MKTLTKAAMIGRLREQLGFTMRESKEVIEGVFEEMLQALERGSPVQLPRFGTFRCRQKAERHGLNPKTGESIPVSARSVVTFNASRQLRVRL